MSKSVDLPDGFTEHRDMGSGGAAQSEAEQPCVSMRSDDKIAFINGAKEMIGQPDALRFFVRGNQVALIPCNPSHPNAYEQQKHRDEYAAGWLKYELECGQPTVGHYPLKRDGELWIVDFAPEARLDD